MDSIKLFNKNEEELETIIQTMGIYSQYIEMEFTIKNRSMVIMKDGKRLGIELPNQDKIGTLGEMESNKHLGILEVDTIKHAEMKDKKWKFPCRTRKILETR